MQLTSSAFAADGAIPEKYTCDGGNVSPPLSWSGAPPETETFALICHDPDAASGNFIHWVIFDIPGDTSHLDEGLPPKETLPNGAMQGANGRRRTGYTGPCPPSGSHRYYFRLYALDARLNLGPGTVAQQVEAACQGHTLAQAELLGRYERRRA